MRRPVCPRPVDRDEPVEPLSHLHPARRAAGYGANYQYDHDAEGGFSGANYWPDELPPQEFYTPTSRSRRTRRTAQPSSSRKARRRSSHQAMRSAIRL
jgi:replication-associated recombination protein RarA